MNQTILRELLDIVKVNQQKQCEIDGKYNIFYALRIWQKEVILHSRMLTDLLRVDGYHGLKMAPLQAFVDLLPIKTEFQCDEKVEVTDEKGAGGRRRIDIFLKDAKGQVIIIENKIYAGDQDRQLIDYREFGLEQTDKPTVLYLTLNGTQPSKSSCRELEEGEGYFSISYGELIKNWIEQCIEMAENAHNSTLVEVLNQYKQVIEYLVEKDMENVTEILAKINTPEDYKAITELATAVGSIPSTVRKVFLEKLAKQFKSAFPQLYKKEREQTVWCDLDTQNSSEGLHDWFSIKESSGRLWCSLTVYKNNIEGKYLQEETERKERFAKVYDNVGIKAVCNGSDYWFWLDEVINMKFDEYETIKDILNSDTPAVVESAAIKITKLLNAYREISAK